MATWRTIMQVDAFTTKPCTGNAAGVLPDASDLDPVQMQRIAREMNVSETAFVLPSDVADFRLRWWTPTVEVPLCGHATVAACHVLAELNRLQVPGAYRIETAVGVLDVALEPAAGAPCRVWLDIPIPEFESSPILPVTLAGALRAEETMFVKDMLPVRGGEYIYLAFNKLTELLGLHPDMAALEFISRTYELSGLVCWSQGGVSPDSAIHMRFFAPAFGINEDPVTGSAHGPLGALVAGLGLVKPAPGTQQVRYRAEQGDAMSRPGRVDVLVDLDAQGEPVRSRIGGVGVTVLRGEICI